MKAASVASARARLGAPPTLGRDPIVFGLVAATALAIGWLLYGPAPVFVSWLIQVGLDVIFAAASWRVAVLGAALRPIRRFWRGLALAGLVWTAGDAWQTFEAIRDPVGAASGSTPQMVLVATGVATVLWMTLTHPINAVGRERQRLWLDAGTVMSAVAVGAWTVTLGGGQLPDTPDRVLSTVVSGALMLASAFGLVKLVLSGNAPFTVRSAMTGGISASLVGLQTSATSLLADLHHDRLVTLIRVLPCVVVAATPHIQVRQMRRDPAALTPRARRPYSKMPYLAVGGTQLLLVWLLATEGLTPRTWGVVVGVLGSTGLVVIRQLNAFSDNVRLVAELDTSMLELRRQEERFRSLVQHASDITLVIDRRGRIGYASPALGRVLGAHLVEDAGDDVMAMVHPDDRVTAGRLIVTVLADAERSASAQLRARHADGSWRWLEVVATNLLANPGARGIVLNARDVTDARQFQDRLQHEATHDNLTQLANRALFHERMRVASFGRAADAPTSVIAIDLDDFKIINDTLGHHAGDALLVAVARRLEGSVRPTDTVARLGGDEFAVLLPDTSTDGAARVAQRILAAFADPVYVEGAQLDIRASLGIAGGSTGDADWLLRQADMAMYSAKHQGKGRCVVSG